MLGSGGAAGSRGVGKALVAWGIQAQFNVQLAHVSEHRFGNWKTGSINKQTLKVNTSLPWT